MKKILIIEDDKYKCADIMSFITTVRPCDTFETAESLSSGYKRAVQNHFDFLIVDLNIPNFDKKPGAIENTLPNGGELLVKTMFNMGIKPRFLIMTQYENFGNETLSTIENRLKNDFGELFYGTIHYASDTDNWKNNLQNILSYALDIDS